MKKLLLLGASSQQIPSIKMAKQLGYYTVTCDYLPNNPGHKFSDENYNVSTTDIPAVLALAQKLKIDGIVAYASDPAAPTAAYVAEKMGLPSSPFKAVETLSNKALFRKFLKEHHFFTPDMVSASEIEGLQKKCNDLRYPLIVKPVDSSGSKGVTKIVSGEKLFTAAEEAFRYSRSHRIIIEEFIQKKGFQISGDGFSVNGKLVFRSWGNEYYGTHGIKEYVPLGECWPCLLSDDLQTKIHRELQRLIQLLGMTTSAYNIEVILDQNDNVYIMELGARNGGSWIPQLIQRATGVNLVEYTIKAAAGEDCSTLKMLPSVGFWSNYMIHSTHSGTFSHFDISPELKDNILEIHSDFRTGKAVEAFMHAGHAIGTAIFQYQSKQEMLDKIRRMPELFKVVLK